MHQHHRGLRALQRLAGGQHRLALVRPFVLFSHIKILFYRKGRKDLKFLLSAPFALFVRL
jgi:hypothetical protein